jgi:hypothetical protein
MIAMLKVKRVAMIQRGKKSSRERRQESKGRKEKQAFFFAPFASWASLT